MKRLCLLLVLSLSSAALADGPADNQAEKVRPVPPPGVAVPAEVKTRLEAGLAEFKQHLQTLASRKDARIQELLPDVLVYDKAVRDALQYSELFSDKEFPIAEKILAQGLARATALLEGKAPWTTQTGLVVRGYVSQIDGSVQPYGLVIPESYQFHGPVKHRLDVWLHGRGEVLSELNFINGAQNNRGVFTPPDTIVLHPYGRYCNAFKLAGEIDILEGMESVQKRYRIDADRIAIRGFSMGGAGCWQMAVHYPDLFVGATPGAGFSETPEFLKIFQKEDLKPEWFEEKLWQMYDCPHYAANLVQLPTIAYSGDQDIQKQAADIMAEACKKEGLDLLHLIGPDTKHSYHPVVKEEIDRRLTSIALKGRDRFPDRLHLTTFTLRYNRMDWLTIDGLQEHWVRADADAAIVDRRAVAVLARNVTALTLNFPSGHSPFQPTSPVHIVINDQQLEGPKPLTDRSWTVSLHQVGDEWKIGPAPTDKPAKRHQLQGPIDDAFMGPFLFVTPSGQAKHPKVQKWVESELAHAKTEWRRQFRGDAKVIADTALTDAEIANNHLVLWGDPQSNAVLAKIAAQLPIQWTGDAIQVGEKKFPAAEHALIQIFPNPLNPKKYVVLNSSFTYREFDYLNNARQVPKLPDWAVVNLQTPPNSRWPGKIVAADFFGEKWELKPAR